QVSVLNAGASASNSLPFTIAIPLGLTGLTATSVPSQPITVGLSLPSPATAPLDGTLTLSFQANAANTTPGYRDPALQFAAGGTALNFTIPAGATNATLPQNGAIQQGTVAGTVTVAVTRLVSGNSSILPSSPPSRSVDVPRLPPVIVPGT